MHYMVNHHRWTDMNSFDCNLVDHLSAIVHGLKMAMSLVSESGQLAQHSVVERKKRNLQVFDSEN